MGKVAFLFAGQGAQHPGMGKAMVERERAARTVFEGLEALRPGLSALCLEGSAEELSQTENTQPCVFAVDLACARALADHGVLPDAVAGFSLGEVAALAFAGAFSDEDAFRLVLARADLMAHASREHPGSMRAVVRLRAERVEELAAEAGDAWPVNYNSPLQTVVAGSEDALVRLDALVRQAGGRSLRVAVSGAFHSPLMASATAGLAEWLGAHRPRATRVPVWANATGEPYGSDPLEMAGTLATQASHPVLWTKTLRSLASWGVDTFVEVGPGTTLTKLVGHTLEGVRALPCETPEQLDVVVSSIKGV